jgi:REP element-mobilizing transposase RayT
VSEHVLRRHNKTLLLYHLVCPAKYWRKVFTEAVEHTLTDVGKGIAEKRYEMPSSFNGGREKRLDKSITK